jgi:hypothetical protein
MAIEKILQTRIMNKVDTLENWGKSTLKIKQGEICFATVAASAGNGLTEPVVMAKIGTSEEKTFAELPWSFYAKASDVLEVAKDATKLTAFINNVIADADMTTNDKFVELSGKVDTLNGDEATAGSVAKAIKDAIDALDLANTYVAKEGYIAYTQGEKDKLAGISAEAKKVEASETNGNIKIDGVETVVYTHPEKHTVADISDFDEKVKLYDYATKTEAQGYANAKDEAIAAAKKAGDDAQSDVDTLETNVGSVDGLSTTNKTVVGAINEVLAAVGTGGTAAVVTVEKSTDGLSYTIKQGNATVGTIDIPKDMVVTAGEVVTNPEGQAEGTYIKLTLANVADPLYINVGTLVDIYKAHANATQVQVDIDSATREISATIVSGSIGTTELADNAVVTAKIADANVTKAKLSTEVQTSLGLADTAVQEADIADLRNASHTHKFVEAELDKIADGDVAKWNAAEQNAKDYADGKVSDLAGGQVKTNKEAIEAINNETTGILAQAKAYSDSLNHEDTKYTAAPDGGLKLDENNAFSIDDSITFIFDCGDSGVTA